MLAPGLRNRGGFFTQSSVSRPRSFHVQDDIAYRAQIVRTGRTQKRSPNTYFNVHNLLLFLEQQEVLVYRLKKRSDAGWGESLQICIGCVV